MQASRKIIDHEMCDAGQVGKPRRHAWGGNERMLRSAQPEVARNTGQQDQISLAALLTRG